MATVTKDFKVKAGLIVEGTNGTINGSDIITEDIITGGTQTNIAVTYNPTTKTLDFVAENGVADSTTSDLVEGSNLYFTDERVDDRVAALVTGGKGITVTYDDNGNALGISTEFAEFTTSDITEGTNLYFTAQRAIDAVGGSASSDNIPGTVVKRDTNGSFAAENITANDVTVNNIIFEDNGGSIGTDVTGLNIFAPTGDIMFGAQTGQVKIGGSEVTTASNTQTLTNKTIGDTLVFNDGSSNSSIDVIGNDLHITANTNLQLNTNNGDITLNPDGFAYITSTTEANKIATQGYVDNAVAGLAWKESAHLLWSDPNATLTGDTGTLIIDGHPALTNANSGYRILILSGTNAGIWVYSDNNVTWTLTRPEDADTAAELVGAAIFIMEGTQYNATSWVQSNHYLTDFSAQNWTQFSGTGNYTAGFGINLVGREFSADTVEMATTAALETAVDTLTTYVNDQDSATLLAANGFSTNLVATGDATATPQYLAINVNDIAKQVASSYTTVGGSDETIYSFADTYRSAKFLVQTARGTHTEVSEVLVTLDTSDNIAITEYAIVGTNGSLGTITAGYDGLGENVLLKINTPSETFVKVFGTLII